MPGSEPPDRLRIVTTVPREHVLEVLPGDEAAQVRFVSRRFRCDDAYCVRSALEPLRAAAGILAVDLRSEAAPPEVLVTYDPAVTDLEAVVAALAAGLRAQPDPLYTRELEVRFPQ